jgi:hypothetical protein
MQEVATVRHGNRIDTWDKTFSCASSVFVRHNITELSPNLGCLHPVARVRSGDGFF